MADCSDMISVLDLLDFKVANKHPDGYYQETNLFPSELHLYAVECSALREEIDRLKKEQTESKKLASGLQQEVRRLEKDNTTLLDKLAKQEKCFAAANSKLKEKHKAQQTKLRKQVCDGKKEIRGFKKSWDSLAQERSAYLHKIEDLERTILQYRIREENLQRENKGLVQINTSLSDEKDGLKAELLRLDAGIKEGKSIVADLFDENNKLQSDLAAKCDNLKAVEMVVQEQQQLLEGMKEKQQQDEQNWTSRLSDLEQTIKMKEAVIDGIAKGLVNVKRAKGEITDKFNNLSDFIERLNADFETNIDNFEEAFCTRVDMQNNENERIGENESSQYSLEVRLEKNLQRLATVVRDTLRERCNTDADEVANDSVPSEQDEDCENNYRHASSDYSHTCNDAGLEMLSLHYESSDEGEAQQQPEKERANSPYIPVVSPVTPAPASPEIDSDSGLYD